MKNKNQMKQTYLIASENIENRRNKNLKSISKFQTQNSKFHSGITLIALVVTVVVLLILAGVTITLMFGENNIFDLAKDAADKTNQAIKDETEGVGKIDSDINKWANGGTGEDSEKPDVPPTPEIPKGPNGKPLVSSITKNDTDNQKVEDKNGKPITIPAGFTVLAHGTDGVVYNHDATGHTPTVEDGIVVQDSVGNQFVWVPVDDIAYSKMIDETNHRGNLYDFGSYNSTTQTWTPYTTPKSKDYSATGYREPDTVTSNGSYKGDEVPSNYTDANIKDKEGNLITGKEGFQTLLQTEFNQMVASVKEHKGFYIGRYETGNLQPTPNTNPVVQRGDTNIGNVNWYYMYANSKNIAKNDKYTSSMIWGCQWDAALDWLVATNGGNYSLVTDSSSWGNYKDQTFDYTVKTETGTTTAKKEKDTATKTPTGSTERNKKNNIYDMAGNVYEWTIEAYYTNYRVLRRGRLRQCRLWPSGFLPRWLLSSSQRC